MFLIDPCGDSGGIRAQGGGRRSRAVGCGGKAGGGRAARTGRCRGARAAVRRPGAWGGRVRACGGAGLGTYLASWQTRGCVRLPGTVDGKAMCGLRA
eukprot:355058-Chlamydomonas_euryale.AAC.4